MLLMVSKRAHTPYIELGLELYWERKRHQRTTSADTRLLLVIMAIYNVLLMLTEVYLKEIAVTLREAVRCY